MKPFLENVLLMTQSLFYLTAITILILLALFLYQDMKAQNAYHEREDAKLQQSLHRSEQLLSESRQSLADHAQQMQRLAR